MNQLDERNEKLRMDQFDSIFESVKEEILISFIKANPIKIEMHCATCSYSCHPSLNNSFKTDTCSKLRDIAIAHFLKRNGKGKLMEVLL